MMWPLRCGGVFLAGIAIITPSNLFLQLETFIGEGRNLKIKRGYWLIWNSVILVLWKARNAKIFNNLARDCKDIVDEIKMLSWK